MSGADGIQINNLERAVSDDINNLESWKDRNLLEVLKYMLAGTELQPTTTLTTVRAAGRAQRNRGGQRRDR